MQVKKVSKYNSKSDDDAREKKFKVQSRKPQLKLVKKKCEKVKQERKQKSN